MPEINAGSMADIAFLLLIFFLVTTTMDIDSGILKKIPEKQDQPQEIIIKDRNILEVNLNRNNQVLIDNEIVSIKKIQQLAIDFIDNGGGLDKNKKRCYWCTGKKLANLSDHPSKAFISINSDRATNYETYVKTLDKLNSAYTILRNKLSQKMYNISYTELLKIYQSNSKKKENAYTKIKVIREKYPLLISDIENTN